MSQGAGMQRGIHANVDGGSIVLEVDSSSVGLEGSLAGIERGRDSEVEVSEAEHGVGVQGGNVVCALNEDLLVGVLVLELEVSRPAGDERRADVDTQPDQLAPLLQDLLRVNLCPTRLLLE